METKAKIKAAKEQIAVYNDINALQNQSVFLGKLISRSLILSL